MEIILKRKFPRELHLESLTLGIHIRRYIGSELLRHSVAFTFGEASQVSHRSIEHLLCAFQALRSGTRSHQVNQVPEVK